MTDSESDADASAPARLPDALESVFRDGRGNAALAWIQVAVLALVLVESAVGLDLEWTVVVLVTGAIAVVPPVAYREWRVMLPWELLALAGLPILVRGLLGGEVGTFATYLAVAALALLIIVELHMFTALEVTHWFAVTLVVLTTMAVGAATAMLRWSLDRYLGTSYLADLEALMDHLIWVSLAGVAAGVLFDAYFRRRDRELRRAIWRRLPGTSSARDGREVR